MNLTNEKIVACSAAGFIGGHLVKSLQSNGRNSEQALVQKDRNWEAKISLKESLRKTFDWIDMQVEETYAAIR